VHAQGKTVNIAIVKRCSSFLACRQGAVTALIETIFSWQGFRKHFYLIENLKRVPIFAFDIVWTLPLVLVFTESGH